MKRLSFPIYFLLFYILWALRATVFYSAVDLSLANETTRLVFANIVKMLLWVVPAIAYILGVDKKNPLQVMRINTRVDRRGVALTCLVTIIYVGLVFTVEYLVNHRTLSPLLQATPSTLLASFLAVLVSPFSEELLFRGFILSKLQENHSLTAANIWQAVLFAAMHLPFWVWLNGLHAGLLFSVISVFMLGSLLGWITHRANSIWLPVGVHILNNFLVSFLG